MYFFNLGVKVKITQCQPPLPPTCSPGISSREFSLFDFISAISEDLGWERVGSHGSSKPSHKENESQEHRLLTNYLFQNMTSRHFSLLFSIKNSENLHDFSLRIQSCSGNVSDDVLTLTVKDWTFTIGTGTAAIDTFYVPEASGRWYNLGLSWYGDSLSLTRNCAEVRRWQMNSVARPGRLAIHATLHPKIQDNIKVNDGKWSQLNLFSLGQKVRNLISHVARDGCIETYFSALHMFFMTSRLKWTSSIGVWLEVTQHFTWNSRGM